MTVQTITPESAISGIPVPPQTNWLFVEELKKNEKRRFAPQEKTLPPGAVSLKNGVRLCIDSAKSLSTASADLKSFFSELGIPEGAYPISTAVEDCGPFDSFCIRITQEMCCICGSNFEGIRRGIFHLEDLILANGAPFLVPGVIHKKAWLKNRISRCFFGPIKRPPLNRDELLDEFDYYPDAYLNRLAHEGVNGLWLTVTFKDLCRTEFAPEYGKNAPQRLAKLRRTVSQCLRYGIKTWLFMIEPFCWEPDDPVIQRFPELAGAILADGRRCFCPSTETAMRYLYESTNCIFKAVPDLGGIINISYGERPTTCLSSVQPDQPYRMECPHCGKLEPKEILYNSVSAMTKGMQAAAPEAEFISWCYVPQTNQMEDWIYSLNHLPEGATALWNFESGGTEEQLGKIRIGGDYWLSYVGPSDRFRRFSANFPAGKKPGAKLQVCCSHELATVPYIPVPGLLYRKYQKLHDLGCETVMQCWYFGNYPGLMNKAAGMLGFEDFSGNEHNFLESLLKPSWGKYASDAAKVYEECSEAYTNYPLSNAMQYYGPFHDGAVWPLYIHEQNLPLAPTWKGNFPVSGDTIGECLDNHTLEEVTELSERLLSRWSHAAGNLYPLEKNFTDNPERLREIDLMRVLELHFTAARDIFRFYLERSCHSGITETMKEIFVREIALSRELAGLCKKDSRIGFHSEAENYKYFPEKLEMRAKVLEKELASPLPPRDIPVMGLEHQEEGFRWQLEFQKENLLIFLDMTGHYDGDQIFITLREKPETRTFYLDLSQSGNFYPSAAGSRFQLDKHSDGWSVLFTVPYRLFTSNPGAFRIAFARLIRHQGTSRLISVPHREHFPNWRLNLGFYLPEAMYQIRK